MKKGVVFIGILCIMLMIIGCAPQAVQEPVEKEEVHESADIMEDAEDAAPDVIVEEPETEPVAEEPEEVVVAPVKEPVKYEEAEAEPSDEEKDNCGCTFTWDPICGKDGKTYINRCLFKCFGKTDDDIETSAQCIKKKGPVKIYTDDTEIDYEPYKWNGGYCWRQTWQDAGIRYCKNLIVNGLFNEEPEPERGNWIDEEHLVMDRHGESKSSTLKLSTGDTVWNEEYNTVYQPLFEQGKYRLSFWARQDMSANNDWRVKLTLKDWWDTKPRPVGLTGCYSLMTEIKAEEVYIEVKPNKWRHYHYEFDVPLNQTQWISSKRESADCEFDWDNIPHGYKIEIIGPTIGDAWFDDFVLEKI